MTLIVSAIFGILFCIALLHAAWAFGIVWPARDEKALADIVIGTPGLTKMPGRAATLIAAVAIAAAGTSALWSVDMIALPLPDWMRAAAAPVLLLIFGLRGLITYIAGSVWPRTEPFATLDRHYFAPLCLLLALGFGLILING